MPAKPPRLRVDLLLDPDTARMLDELVAQDERTHGVGTRTDVVRRLVRAEHAKRARAEAREAR